MRKKIGIIGTGRVGTALGYALHKKGYTIIGAYDRNPKKVRAFNKLLKLKYVPFSNQKIAGKVDIIFITTQDSEIEKVYNKILPYVSKGQIIIHCSGVLSNSIFKQADKKGIITIGIHPIQTFPTIKQSIGATKNIYYTVEAIGKAKAIAKRIVKDLECFPVFIRGKDKPLYHIMCVFVSNYLNALISSAIDIAKKLTIKPETAYQALEPLIYKTLENIKQFGVEKSLSGPIERGDINTIKTHLEVLNKKIPELLPLYQVLGLKTLTLVKTKIATETQRTQREILLILSKKPNQD